MAALAALAIVLGGCLSIKSQELTQTRAPGVVTLGGVVCGSDYNADTYPGCDDTGSDPVAELDNRANNSFSCDADSGPGDGFCGTSGDGQLLVGFRVPVGSDGPASFLTDVNDLQLNKSASYTEALQTLFPAPPGQHWVGYISTVRTFQTGPAAFNPTGIHPEFTLPAQPDGAPFPGPFRWRWVVGFRGIAAANAGDPVDCGVLTTFCVDSPPQTQVQNDLPAENVSDFGVLTGANATAGHGETATVAFPIQYLDGRGMGQRDLTISATTNLPGTSATPSVTTLGAQPNSTNTVNVAVPVPPGTQLGAYTVTLTASEGTPAVTRSNSATINVVDKIAPSIRISVPAEGRTLRVGQRVLADYGCSEEANGSGVRSCAGPVASGARIDTRRRGTKTFTVAAVDNAGNAASLTRTYRVALRPPRRFSLSRDFSAFARFTLFSRMQVKDILRGSTVKATCKVRSRRCPGKARKPFTRRRARGTVSLNKRYKGVRLPVGTKITVRVATPGFITSAQVLTVRAAKRPTVVDRCVRPGSTRLRRRC